MGEDEGNERRLTHLITRPTPMGVTKGAPRSRDESNLDPSWRVPTSVTRAVASERNQGRNQMMGRRYESQGDGAMVMGERRGTKRGMISAYQVDQGGTYSASRQCPYSLSARL